jgi:hypothetical protein
MAKHVQEIWADYWQSRNLNKLINEAHGRYTPDYWARLEEKERRNVITHLVNEGARIALEEAPQAGGGTPIPGAYEPFKMMCPCGCYQTVRAEEPFFSILGAGDGTTPIWFLNREHYERWSEREGTS